MGTGASLDLVMNAFKAPANRGRYFFDGCRDLAQSHVNTLTQGELQGFGLDTFLVVKKPDPHLPVISFGPFKDKVDAPALFHRLDQLFMGRRLPESRHAEASIRMPTVESDILHLPILQLFGAMRAAGAKLSLKIKPVLEDDAYGDGHVRVPKIGENKIYGSLEAVFEQDDVVLSCRVDVIGAQTIDRSINVGPITIKEISKTMSLEASLPRHGLAMDGHWVLESGLDAILSPLVEGNAPFFVMPGSDSLVVGACGALKKSYLEGASADLGIGMDGTVTIPE